MNTSQPVPSSIEGVGFDVLSSDDIEKLSVKRVTNPIALDRLLHPIPSGLHDPAFGAFMDHACTTCHLNIHSCPGHCGHIELPVQVYHCLYFEQVLRLLRMKCDFCHHFKVASKESNRCYYKLVLIEHGLFREAKELDDLDEEGKYAEEFGAGDNTSEAENPDDIIRRRAAFVQRCINSVPNRKRNWTCSPAYIESRRNAVREFFAIASKTKTCCYCQAISPGIRKATKTDMSLWKVALNWKSREHNNNIGRTKVENSLLWMQKYNEEQERIRERAKLKIQKQNVQHIDEGVADMDSPDEVLDEIQVLDGPLEGDEPMIDEEEDKEEEEEEEEGEDLMSGSDQDEAQTTATSTAHDTSKKSKQNTTQSRRKKDRAKDERLFAGEAYAMLMQLFQKEHRVLNKIYNIEEHARTHGKQSPDRFFINRLLVPPNKYRKEQVSQPGKVAESPDNTGYRNILNNCIRVYQIQREISEEVVVEGRQPRGFPQLQTSLQSLQESVNCLIDKDLSSSTPTAKQREPDGVKQRIEKKEGLFRMNIMGKRVNFCARSVISPDPNLDTTEIGIPTVFAKRLTYPEPVFQYNTERLRSAIQLGYGKLGGAAAVEMENGQVISLRRKKDEDRQALSNTLWVNSCGSSAGFKPKKVHRYLRNGDLVIMNRQPSLHKPSMMAHKARILPGEKTIRMHYANCKSYNADFDGDEMNLHFPQTPTGQAEAAELANTDLQYLSATAGDPLRGLVQDHVSMGIRLTSLDTWFTRDEYHQLLYTSLQELSTSDHKISTIGPAILKPRSLWSGKQIVTTILRNIKPDGHGVLEMTSKSKVPANSWGPKSEENDVRVRKGDLITGVLDSKNIGASKGGLVHSVYEAYGAEAAGQFLSILGRLLTQVLNMKAFSCGVEDLVMTQEGELDRTKKLEEAQTLGLEVASRYVSLEGQQIRSDDSEMLTRMQEVYRDDNKLAGLDQLTSNAANKLSGNISKACLPNGLSKSFPRNQFQLMTTSGAKGSQVNANQISCNLGQQALEGRRVPVMVSGKSLPAFKPFEPSVRAGGYIVNRFITGLRPQEYYFHAMAGREGLIDTAVKTSRSGYLQRCLVKGLEGLTVGYDTSVRNSDGTVVQATYGEDGVDVTKQTGLNDFSFIGKNFVSFFAKLDVRDEARKTRSEEAMEHNKAAVKALSKRRPHIPDPTLSVYSPSTHGGSTSEKYYRLVKDYIDTNPDGVIKQKKAGINEGYRKDLILDIFNTNYLKALVQPGEAIGVVAAQSIGEPSTQMTLNTFHLAGHAAKNVTLGVPRLREILMTASVNIKTPTMELYFYEDISLQQRQIFAKSITRRSFAELIKDVSVEERLVKEGQQIVAREYNAEIQLFPVEDYHKEYSTSIHDVSLAIDSKFMAKLFKLIVGRRSKKAQEMEVPEIGERPKSRGNPAASGADAENEDGAGPFGAAQNEGGDSDDDDGGDNDATDAKRKANRDEDATFEDPEESDEDERERAMTPEIPEVPEDEAYGSGSDGDEASKRKSKEPVEALDALASSDAHRLERLQKKHSNLVDVKFSHSSTRSSLTFTLRYASDVRPLQLLDVISQAAKDATIHSLNGITSGTLLSKDENDESSEKYVLTSGQNLGVMRAYTHIINPHRTRTNDIHAMLNLYGVEAARSTIIAELQNVFGAHSISVDVRHLTLVADYMTQGGGYTPFSRTGMRDEPEVFKKMSFESTLNFLMQAVLDGEVEELKGPSARITVGRPMRGGTGLCDIMTDVSERRKDRDDNDETVKSE